MKKSKTRVGRNYKIPKGSLIVDCSSRRGVLPYTLPLDLYDSKELHIIIEWCEKTFPAESWGMHATGWPGHIYFLEENYVTMFLLMWAK